LEEVFPHCNPQSAIRIPQSAMVPSPSFLFTTCQVGAEGALKSEMARREAAFHLAFSRPGFVTFKLPEDRHRRDELPRQAVFARTQGFSLGKVTGEDDAARAAAFWQLAGAQSWDRLHVWQRDTAHPGFHGFQPGITPLARQVEQVLRAALADSPQPPLPLEQIDQPTQEGSLVLDCIVVEPDVWWAGWHRALRPESCWTGGIPPLEMPADAASRAWLKMEEALLWSQLPMQAGQRVAEIGCAPGGAAQALLSRGLLVTGIDPALVDPCVAAHPNFTQIRKRGHEVRRREFRKTRWIVADMNVAPRYTLDTVEAIVTHPEANIRGMLLTLKLLDWSMAHEIPLYLARIRSWGFTDTHARQLAHNRQEVCVAARTKPLAQR
jgi:23S rRNA (cytidine2498-2'-O)-methyltransferase